MWGRNLWAVTLTLKKIFHFPYVCMVDSSMDPFFLSCCLTTGPLLRSVKLGCCVCMCADSCEIYPIFLLCLGTRKCGPFAPWGGFANFINSSAACEYGMGSMIAVICSSNIFWWNSFLAISSFCISWNLCSTIWRHTAVTAVWSAWSLFFIIMLWFVQELCFSLQYVTCSSVLSHLACIFCVSSSVILPIVFLLDSGHGFLCDLFICQYKDG